MMVNTSSLNIRLHPYLQDTYSRRIIEGSQHPSKLLHKAKMVTTIAVAIIETVAYLTMQLCTKAVSLIIKAMNIQAIHYKSLTKGALSALVVATISLWDRKKADSLRKEIETSVDDTLKHQIAEGSKILELQIQAKLKNRKKNDSPEDRCPIIWDEQMQKLRSKSKQTLHLLSEEYTSLKSNQKYHALEQIKQKINELADATDSFVLYKKDPGFNAYYDNKAAILAKIFLKKLPPENVDRKRFIHQELKKFKEIDSSHKPEAFEKFKIKLSKQLIELL